MTTLIDHVSLAAGVILTLIGLWLVVGLVSAALQALNML